MGVYWMFYTGGDFQPVEAPGGLPGAPAAGAALEGLRMRPGLAMSQVGRPTRRGGVEGGGAATAAPALRDAAAEAGHGFRGAAATPGGRRPACGWPGLAAVIDCNVQCGPEPHARKAHD